MPISPAGRARPRRVRPNAQPVPGPGRAGSGRSRPARPVAARPRRGSAPRGSRAAPAGGISPAGAGPRRGWRRTGRRVPRARPGGFEPTDQARVGSSGARRTDNALALDRDPIRDLAQPAAQDLALADRAGSTGQDQEGGLERILDLVRVAEHAPADAQDHRPVAQDQRLEGGLGRLAAPASAANRSSSCSSVKAPIRPSLKSVRIRPRTMPDCPLPMRSALPMARSSHHTVHEPGPFNFPGGENRPPGTGDLRSARVSGHPKGRRRRPGRRRDRCGRAGREG